MCIIVVIIIITLAAGGAEHVRATGRVARDPAPSLPRPRQAGQPKSSQIFQ